MKHPYSTHRGEALIWIATTYLILPILVFIAGFLKPVVSIPLLILLATATFRYTQSVFGSNWTHYIQRGIQLWKIDLPAFAILFLWLLIAGVGGLTFQNHDYIFFNATLKALIQNQWPLVLATPSGEDFYFSYYIGYFLVPALVGKQFGWIGANLATLAMAVAGTLISYRLFKNFVENYLKKRLSLLQSSLLAGFMVIFGGLDVLGYSFEDNARLFSDYHMEWWNTMFQFSSNSTLVFWVPQQSIAIWVVTGVVLNCTSKVSFKYLGLSVSALLLYSPFGAVGVAFILALASITIFRKDYRSLLSFNNLVVTPLISFVLASYIMSNTFSFPIKSSFSYPGFFSKYLTFILIEFVFWIPLLWTAFRRSKDFTLQYKQLLAISLSSLFVIPLIVIGYSNDFSMRVSVAPLAILFCFAFLALYPVFSFSSPVFSPSKLAAILVLTAISFNFIHESMRAVELHNLAILRPIDSITDYLDLPAGKGTLDQRKGDPSKFFYVYLSKKAG